WTRNDPNLATGRWILSSLNVSTVVPVRRQTDGSPEMIYKPHELREFALAYVERCRGDVPQLEREREVLLAALEQVWRLEQYELVVRLMTGLVYLTGRFDDAEVARKLLLRGIYACERIQDRSNYAHFLSRLSGLLWSRGEYRQAKRIWNKSLQIASASGLPVSFWEPLYSLVYIVDIIGKDGARPFAETLLHRRDDDNAATIAMALFMRAFNARCFGQVDRAYDDLCACTQHLAALDAAPSFYKPFFEVEVQAELARVRGDYANARVYAEAALALAQSMCDPYIVADLLCDQIWFALWMGMDDDAYLLLVRLIELTKQQGTPHHYAFSVLLSKRLPEHLRASLIPLLTANVGAQCIAPVAGPDDIPQHHEASMGIVTSPIPAGAMHCAPTLAGLRVGEHTREEAPWFYDALSRSELDVLRLLAAGLSNREIAANLVIAVGTVKKHIEHIYSKLDAHSRTQAVARARTLALLD
ncbi:MAG TPA: response regulator transcription factor, partial [Ktedonobacteraceae bacterium]|nr:response regulator transcription factor [Ktedonobacteraceae bacterium]